MPLEHVFCPICENDDPLLIDDRTQAQHRVCTVQCRQCGGLYLNPRESSEVYHAYYRVGFSHDLDRVTSEVAAKPLADHAQPKTERTLRFLKPFLRPRMRVLEIGAGFGNLLAALRDRHQAALVQGIEPDPEGARVAKEMFHLEIRTQTWEEFLHQEHETGFDLILMHHVLEHFLDPNSVLEKLHDLLAPEGLVYIGVPNATAPAAPLSSFFRFPHVTSFTPFTLALILWRHNLKIVASDRLTKPLAIVAAPLSSRRHALSWIPFIKRSANPATVRCYLHLYGTWHALRLWWRDGVRTRIGDLVKGRKRS